MNTIKPQNLFNVKGIEQLILDIAWINWGVMLPYHCVYFVLLDKMNLSDVVNNHLQALSGNEDNKPMH